MGLRVPVLAVWLLLTGCGSGAALERSARAEAPHPRSIEGDAPEDTRGAAPASPLSAACTQTGQPIVKTVTQLVVVRSADFDAWRAELQRYARSASGAWQAVSEPISVVLGRAGYAWGDGVHGSGAPDGRPGPLKREGDGRSPAGVFAIGTVHGYAAKAPEGSLLAYEQASAQQRCVDDPRAAEYNRIVEAGARVESWRSAERMRRDDAVYELALDIEHNRSPVVPGHGSCIFAHVWVNAQTPVAGCTGMGLSELKELLIWLKPGALWVSLPIQEYQALRACWDLP
jgi:D-alanyl-D-alanine dipeptidase